MYTPWEDGTKKMFLYDIEEKGFLARLLLLWYLAFVDRSCIILSPQLSLTSTLLSLPLALIPALFQAFIISQPYLCVSQTPGHLSLWVCPPSLPKSASLLPSCLHSLMPLSKVIWLKFQLIRALNGPCVCNVLAAPVLPPSTCSKTLEDMPRVLSRWPAFAHACFLSQKLSFLLLACLLNSYSLFKTTAQMPLSPGSFPSSDPPLSSAVPQTTSSQSELGVHTTWTFYLSPKTHSIVVLLLGGSFSLLSSALGLELYWVHLLIPKAPCAASVFHPCSWVKEQIHRRAREIDPQEQMSTNKTMPVLSEGAVLQVCSILINTYLLEIGNAVSKRGKSLRINYLCLLFCLFFLLLVSFFSFLSHSVSLLQL